jgi:hypothetical protein
MPRHHRSPFAFNQADTDRILEAFRAAERKRAAAERRLARAEQAEHRGRPSKKVQDGP